MLDLIKSLFLAHKLKMGVKGVIKAMIISSEITPQWFYRISFVQYVKALYYWIEKEVRNGRSKSLKDLADYWSFI